ncbi:MAG TPA: hypothetical protein VEC35_10345 [Noviherbaspirillum sp.]|nr:hypothetical protein [Noviherbaspirillum sp.]
MRTAVGPLVLLIMGATCVADDASLKNWFDDPFFQVSDGIAGCPRPLGPLLTESEMKSESHSRAERGTSCWMSGACSQPNAYMYDQEIARGVRERLRAGADTSLWITVKRRFVWVEGCVAHPAQTADLESQVKSLPNVEHVLVNVMTGTRDKPPYRTLP